jgi:hypothetical protein
VLIAKEVNPVLKALRDHGIEVTAIHNHMLDDQREEARRRPEGGARPRQCGQELRAAFSRGLSC